MDKELEYNMCKTAENQAAEEECEQTGSNRYSGLIYEMIDMQNNMFAICAKLIIDFVKMEVTE